MSKLSSNFFIESSSSKWEFAGRAVACSLLLFSRLLYLHHQHHHHVRTWCVISPSLVVAAKTLSCWQNLFLDFCKIDAALSLLDHPSIHPVCARYYQEKQLPYNFSLLLYSSLLLVNTTRRITESKLLQLKAGKCNFFHALCSMIMPLLSNFYVCINTTRIYGWMLLLSLYSYYLLLLRLFWFVILLFFYMSVCLQSVTVIITKQHSYILRLSTYGTDSMQTGASLVSYHPPHSTDIPRYLSFFTQTLY